MDPASMSSSGPDHLPAAAVLTAAAALSDELRRQMYAYIRQARRPVSREEAAERVGISRKLAAFHLDKLVEVGLLRAHFEPMDGIRKVGRAPKLYEPTDAGLRITIPAREPDLLADILVDALLAEDQNKTGREAAIQLARARGAELGAAESERARPGRLGGERALTLAIGALGRHGFEPDRTSPTRLRLRNCPFQPLASKAPQLICGINHAFLTGFLDALGASTVTAVLAPRAGECCVELVAE
ncbi:MAG TPA: helix-turn-helix domain-containing protein [Pseudonocardiaceae bacterium]|jgi:predicted ArsR family transcriptional regulator|nr:helix-turn-helix domain-containing protein [Pseudonocardiaceae bacterium]